MADRTRSEKSILQGRYEVGRLIGFGSFAKVYHGRNLQTGDSVAVKILSKEKLMKIGMTEQIKGEIAIMNMVKHPNIVELHQVMAAKSKIYFVMELVRGGELFNKVARGRLKEDSAMLYFRQQISTIDFCHSRGVYHRDLKLENLLLDDDGNLKITDFGLSAISECLKQDGLLHTTCGTPSYVAPEVIDRKGYNGAKADLWSCGVILYVLLAGYLPFEDSNVVELYRKMKHGSFKFPSWFSAEAWGLVSELLDPNSETRATVSKVMESPWLQKTVPRNHPTSEEYVSDEKTRMETLNAFHVISLSSGFSLGPLFEEKKKMEKIEMRFATRSPQSGVISRLEAAAKSGGFVMRKESSRVELRGRETGRKGKVAIAVNIFAVAPSFSVVEVKKEKGDTLEYNEFCMEELRPALKDILRTKRLMRHFLRHNFYISWINFLCLSRANISIILNQNHQI